MTRITRLVLVFLGLVSLTAPLFAEESSLDLEAKLEAVRTQTGPAYLAAREQLLSQPPDVVEPRLQAMKQQAANPLEDLLWDALIIRLKDAQEDEVVVAPPRKSRIDEYVGPPVARTIRLKVEFAIDEALFWAGLDRWPIMRGLRKPGDPPIRDPASGAGVLMRYLGDDAVPIAAELISKGLADNWEPWEREMLLLTLYAYKWWPHDPDRERAMRIKDVRAGWVLLWMAEHLPDEDLGKAAAEDLRSFPDPQLLQAAKAARDRATDAERRVILSKAEENIGRGLDRLGRMRARLEREAVSQPASQPADSASSQPAD